MKRREFLSAVGVGAATAVLPAGMAAATTQARRPAFHVRLDKPSYDRGDVMVLTVREDVGKRWMQVADTSGARWTKRSDNGRRAVFTARAAGDGRQRVTVTLTRTRDQSRAREAVSYSVHGHSGHGRGRWAGHQPGRVYLGQSTPNLAAGVAMTGAIGVHRSFYDWWSSGEDNTIKADHQANRLPWVSFKPPGGASGWQGVANGQQDAAIKARARRYASYAQPVISTFHHEPTNDSDNGAGFAAAWTRIHDVMNAETGLANVTFAPIIGDWEFNPRNRGGHPQDYLPAAVLRRMPFLGIDLYQNGSGDGFQERLGRVLNWMTERGVANPMVGIGETGCCRYESPPTPHSWFDDNWRWVEANTDKIGVVSYFNSTRNSKSGHVWSLDETQEKLHSYQAALRSNTSCRL